MSPLLRSALARSSNDDIHCWQRSRGITENESKEILLALLRWPAGYMHVMGSSCSVCKHVSVIVYSCRVHADDEGATGELGERCECLRGG